MAIKTNTQVVLRFNLKWGNGAPIDLRRHTGAICTLVMPDDTTAAITDLGYDRLTNQIWVRIAGTHNSQIGSYKANLAVMTQNLQMVTTGIVKVYDVAADGEDYKLVTLSLTVTSIDTPVNNGQGYSPKIVNGEWYVYDDSQQSYVPTGQSVIAEETVNQFLSEAQEELDSKVADITSLDEEVFYYDYKEKDLTQLEEHDGYISAQNKWVDSQISLHKVISLNGIDKIRVSPQGNTPIIAFLRSYTFESGETPDYSEEEGFDRRYVMDGNAHPKEPTEFTIPSDAHYLYFRTVNQDGDQSPIIEFYERQSSIEKLEEQLEASTDTVENLLDNARFSDDNDRTFTILQCTDIHGSVDAAEAFLNELQRYRGKIDLAVNTGDLTRAKWSNGIAFWTQISGLESVWNLIGNHDSTVNSTSVWNDVPISDVYNRFIAPYISEWGVVSAGQNLNYYYKDFTEAGLRIIALDAMFIDASEVTWFETVLAGARTANLAVVVLCHYPCGTVNSNTSVTFASIDGANAEQTAPLALNTDCAEKINAFINAGGEFVAWVCGHRHRDDFGYVVNYPNILNITLEKSGGNDGASASSNYRTHDSARIYGTEGQNSFNLITVDRGKKLIKVVRIGNHCDKYLRQKHSLCYNYETKTVISND